MFLILALPRSRTFWLSRLLTYGDIECGHEEARYLRSMADAKIWLTQEHRGSAETALAPFWRLAHKINPNLRVVVVRRPVAEVVKSVMALDLSGIGAFSAIALTQAMTRLDAKLSQIERRLPNVLSVNFHDLDHEAMIKSVFAHCVPYAFDPAWWKMMRNVNLQCNMRAIARYRIAYAKSLDALAKTAKHLSRAELMVTQPRAPDGVTFQQESFDDWERDGVSLFEAHCVEVGEPPDQWKKKNIPLMRALCKQGAMQITTARCNGKMFGYLAAIATPSLEAEGLLSGLHTTFYASKDMPGLGLKLQRASAASLKQKGAGELFFLEGSRGDGPRMGALYRRLGAKEFGKLHRLEFEGV